jgi:homoserine dehydrogenase
MKKVTVGLIGFGTVGAGVVKILRDRKRLLAEKTGTEIVIKKIFDKDITSRRKGVTLEKGILTSDVSEILKDPQIDAVIELIGGIHPAKEFIVEALRNGKNVVTANKALLAEEGRALFALARDCTKSIYFEASVGAGIPIVKSLREGLVANAFESVFGIVNGTSNYILSQMSSENCTFEQALKEAKARGFAEANPALDIDGIDSCHKLVLLAYLCWGRLVDMKDVFTEGISQISLSDINYAREMGFAIKLLAIGKREGDALEVRVHPTLIPESHPMAAVAGVNNAIYVAADLAGDLLFYGPGAGQLSAASGVVSDLVDLTQAIKAGLFRSTLNIIEDKAITHLRKIDDTSSRYYIRFMALDKPGVLAKISGILAKFGISIASVTQKERGKGHSVPIVMIVHEAREKDLRAAMAIINKMDVMRESAIAIRIEEV